MTDPHQMAVDAVKSAEQLEDDRIEEHEDPRPHRRTLGEMRESVTRRRKELAAEKKRAAALADDADDEDDEDDDLDDDDQDDEGPLSTDIVVAALGASRGDDLDRIRERSRRGDDVASEDLVDAALGHTSGKRDMRKVTYLNRGPNRTELKG